MSRILSVILVLITIASLSVAGYFYTQVQKLSEGAPAATADELAEIIEKVGRLVVLPTKEQPTLATVSDPEQLKDQPFFAKAKKGDKVLVYSVAKKVILYDPVADKIVEVAPINSSN